MLSKIAKTLSALFLFLVTLMMLILGFDEFHMENPSEDPKTMEDPKTTEKPKNLVEEQQKNSPPENVTSSPWSFLDDYLLLIFLGGLLCFFLGGMYFIISEPNTQVIENVAKQPLFSSYVEAEDALIAIISDPIHENAVKNLDFIYQCFISGPDKEFWCEVLQQNNKLALTLKMWVKSTQTYYFYQFSYEDYNKLQQLTEFIMEFFENDPLI